MTRPWVLATGCALSALLLLACKSPDAGPPPDPLLPSAEIPLDGLTRRAASLRHRISARGYGEAVAQTRLFEDRLIAGHHLLFFPEGTSTDGRQVLNFKPTLFEAFLSKRLRDRLRVQPVTLRYSAPQGVDDRFYGWWGDMEFGPSLLQILAAPRQGAVTVIYHPPLPVAAGLDRKHLARQAEAAVRFGLVHGTPMPASVRADAGPV